MFTITVEQALTEDATLWFVLDLPTGMELVSDVCLAEAEDGKLTCVSRDITQTSDGWISVPYRPTGNPFAIIFNPDMSLKAYPIPPLVPTPTDVVDPGPDDPTDEPEPTEAEEVCNSIWCRYKWWIIGGSVGFVILIIIIILVCCYLRGRSNS